jgi:hypothetical protein
MCRLTRYYELGVARCCWATVTIGSQLGSQLGNLATERTCADAAARRFRLGNRERLWGVMTLPEGLIYVPGFLTEAEERDVLATFELHPYVLHDTPSRRLVRSFGLARVAGGYDPARRRRSPPSWTGSGTAAPG